jgi:hypothetical protein
VSAKNVRHFIPYSRFDYLHISDVKNGNFNGWMLGDDDCNNLDIMDRNGNFHFSRSPKDVKRHLDCSVINWSDDHNYLMDYEEKRKLFNNQTSERLGQDKEKELIVPGAIIEALFEPEGNLFFKGKIVSVNSSSKTANVRFEDSSEARDLPFKCVRAFTEFKEGEVIYAQFLYKKTVDWYPAKIIGISEMNVFDIVYNDGVRGTVDISKVARSSTGNIDFKLSKDAERNRKYWAKKKQEINVVRRENYIGKVPAKRDDPFEEWSNIHFKNHGDYLKARLLTLHEIKDSDPSTPLVKRHHLGAFNYKCLFCGAKYFESEATQSGKVYTTCCNKGEYLVRGYSQTPPPVLKSLLDGKHAKSSIFKSKILYINSLISFASIKIDTHRFSKGVPAFKMNGKIFHNLGPTHCASPEEASFLQTYFLEGDGTKVYSLDNSIKEIVSLIHKEIKDKNVFIKTLRQIYEFEKALPKDFPTLKLLLKAGGNDGKSHKGTTNLPSKNAMTFGVIFEGVDLSENQRNRRDIVVEKLYPSDTKYKYKMIDALHNSYDSLSYVLFHAFGEAGFDRMNSWRCKDNSSITVRKYYSFILQRRDESPSDVRLDVKLRGAMLTHQYICDAYVKIEDQRLQWIRNNQEKLKADKYRDLYKSVKDKTESTTSRNVILPSSHINSPRFFLQGYADAMAIVRRLGVPDLFITFTCNPDWPEIKDNLGEKQDSWEAVDLIVRVFQQKLKELLHDIQHKSVLGVVKGIIWVIEYQVRVELFIFSFNFFLFRL